MCYNTEAAESRTEERIVMQNLWELGVEYVSVDSIKRAAQRSVIETRFPPEGLRAKLLARPDA